MCGILGFTNYVASNKQIVCATLMAKEMVSRGRQSWGTTNGIDIIKDVGPITEVSIFDTHFDRPSTSPFGCVFGHTRASSHGPVSKDNAHPHLLLNEGGTKKIIGVHNGTVTHTCMTDINTKKFEVDTQVIFDRLVNDQPTNIIEGTGVLVYMQNEKQMRFLRFNSTNLYVAQDCETGGLIYASTKIAVVDSAKMAGIVLGNEITTKPEIIYEVQLADDGGHKLVEIGEQKFSTPKAITYTDSTGATQYRSSQSCGYHGGTYATKLCKSCNTLRPNHGAIGLCTVCEDVAIDHRNSNNKYSFTWWGHYTAPSTNDTSDSAADSLEDHSQPNSITTPSNITVVGESGDSTDDITDGELKSYMRIEDRFGNYMMEGD